MGAPRRQKDLIKSRRRVEDDGEEEGSVAAGAEEDSLSEGSLMSDADDDADAEGSDGEDSASPLNGHSTSQNAVNGHEGNSQDPRLQATAHPTKSPLAPTMADTETMVNGLNILPRGEEKGVDFEDMGKEPASHTSEDIAQGASIGANVAGSIAEQRRREHEEYKKRRDADPAFVPNRGGFFMHDHRSAAPGQNGFRPFGRGRGRGRGGVVVPSMSSRYALLRDFSPS